MSRIENDKKWRTIPEVLDFVIESYNKFLIYKGDNNKFFLQETGQEGVDWGFLSQNRGSVGCCEKDNETLGFTRCGEFLTVSGR